MCFMGPLPDHHYQPNAKSTPRSTKSDIAHTNHVSQYGQPGFTNELLDTPRVMSQGCDPYVVLKNDLR